MLMGLHASRHAPPRALLRGRVGRRVRSWGPTPARRRFVSPTLVGTISRRGSPCSGRCRAGLRSRPSTTSRRPTARDPRSFGVRAQWRAWKGRVSEAAVLLRLTLWGFDPLRAVFDGDCVDWFVRTPAGGHTSSSGEMGRTCRVRSPDRASREVLQRGQGAPPVC